MMFQKGIFGLWMQRILSSERCVSDETIAEFTSVKVSLQLQGGCQRCHMFGCDVLQYISIDIWTLESYVYKVK